LFAVLMSTVKRTREAGQGHLVLLATVQEHDGMD
jgi:hypothetical protein